MVANDSILDLTVRGENNSNLHERVMHFIEELQKEQQSFLEQMNQLKAQWKDKEVCYQASIQALKTCLADLKLELKTEREQTKCYKKNNYILKN